MPVAGAMRKPAGQTVTRQRPNIHEWIDVADVPFKGGPTLPKWRTNQKLEAVPWPKEARERWDAWRAMPHCVHWRQTDWKFAFDAIELVAQLYDERRGNWTASLLTELRDREKVMGTTLDYRRAIRVRYVDPATMKTASGEQGTVTKISDYRDL